MCKVTLNGYQLGIVNTERNERLVSVLYVTATEGGHYSVRTDTINKCHATLKQLNEMKHLPSVPLDVEEVMVTALNKMNQDAGDTDDEVRSDNNSD